MPTETLTIAQVNALDRADFVARLGFLFEGSPWVADAAWPARPFADRERLHAALCAAMYAAPRERQLALIRAHPDLAGKAAITGELTPDSTREQSSAGLDRLTREEFARFTELNAAYRERFAFPFVICVREHTKESTLNQFAERLRHPHEQEIATALGEIAKIARLRLFDLVPG
jgi:OHCU decarboxylase